MNQNVTVSRFPIISLVTLLLSLKDLSQRAAAEHLFMLPSEL